MVHIALTIADLNGLGILSYDIQNAYLTAECRENIWAHSGPEFGSEAGTIMIVKIAICGLKSSGAVFYAHLAEAFNEAIDSERENGNTLWWDVVCQEMKNVCPSFETWEKLEGDIPPGYQDIK